LDTTYEQNAEENPKILGICVMKEENNYRIGLYRSAKNQKLIGRLHVRKCKQDRK
jgi:hypothetical protein